MQYSKPPLSIEAQVELLASRGRTVPDHARACHYFAHSNDSRWLPFEEPGGHGEYQFRSWGKCLRQLLDEYPQADPLMMGFPEDWREREFLGGVA